MEHSEAVRIAQSGEGAVVSELKRLSQNLEDARARIKSMENSTLRYLDAYQVIRDALNGIVFLIENRIPLKSRVDLITEDERNELKKALGLAEKILFT